MWYWPMNSSKEIRPNQAKKDEYRIRKLPHTFRSRIKPMIWIGDWRKYPRKSQRNQIRESKKKSQRINETHEESRKNQEKGN